MTSLHRESAERNAANFALTEFQEVRTVGQSGHCTPNYEEGEGSTARVWCRSLLGVL